MHVTHLHLVDFRNYAEVELSLQSGPVLFIGRNGQGKTNLVEAIAYAGSASSHRVGGDQALIRSGAETAIIRVRVQHDDRALVIELQLNRGAPNRAQINGSAIRLRDLPRYLRSVLFAPEDLALVRGDPGVRRAFLDALVIQRTPRMAGVMADYERVVRQRNSLLKSARSARLRPDQLTTLDVWDDRLVDLGTEVIRARADAVERLRPHLGTAYCAVAGDDHRTRAALRLSIHGSNDEMFPPETVDDASTLAETFRTAVAARRREELDRAVTVVGPHRDDLALELNGLPARGYASHGESWSYALALKLATAAVLREDDLAGDPVVMLDDVFAELDHGRRERLADAVAEYEQVIITAAVGADVPERLAAARIGIHGGRIVQDDP